jgi:uncharacterized protein (TIGR03089 family)
VTGSPTGPLGRARTPRQLLDALVASDPGRPRVTWYDDDGPSAGERIELSAAVLARWVAKAAHLLVDDLDVEPGDRVRLALPPHWRSLYWALAAWAAGAELDPTGCEPAGVGSAPGPGDDCAVLVTTDPGALGSAPTSGTVAVTLPALARRWAGAAALPAAALDEAAVLANHPDQLDLWHESGPDDLAWRRPDGAAAGSTGDRAGSADQGELLHAARELASDQGWPPSVRVAIAVPDLATADHGHQLTDVLLAVLAAWTLDGSVVLEHGAGGSDQRHATERVTSAWRPPGRPASRS